MGSHFNFYWRHYWILNPELGESLKPLGDGFIALVKMMIAPIIFCTVVSGIAGVGDMKKVGRIGGKALIYFEIISTFALAIGLLVANILKPGSGFNANLQTVDASSVAQFSQTAGKLSTVDFIMHIIPKTFLDAFTASGDLLLVLLLAVLFGWAINRAGIKGQPVLKMIDSLSSILFAMIGGIMKLAPIGAGGAMAYTIGKFGLHALLPLASLMGSFYLTCVLFILFILGTVAYFVGFNILYFIRYIKTELLLVLGTSSSESALVPLMEKLERLGCSKSVVGLVIPSGYSFNLDGTNIYMTLAVVPEVPVAGLALILGVDRFMSEARALTNIIGNGVATLVVSRWENELDHAKLKSELHTSFDRGLGDPDLDHG